MSTYTPATLPPLPRARCPFECVRTATRYGSKQDMYMEHRRCSGRPLTNGWCSAHQHCAELLSQGAQIGYPRLQVNIALFIGRGIAAWEGYAVCYPAHRREQVQWAIEQVRHEFMASPKTRCKTP